LNLIDEKTRVHLNLSHGGSCPHEPATFSNAPKDEDWICFTWGKDEDFQRLFSKIIFI